MNVRLTFILLIIISLVAGYFYLYEPPREAAMTEEDTPWFYSAAIQDISAITIQKGAAEQSFVKSGGEWLFAGEKQPPVDPERWGGITLLLTGPATERVLLDKIEDPAQFGFDDPSLIVDVVLKGERALKLILGTRAPDGLSHYARQERDPRLYLLPDSWGTVLGRLATDPPYPTWFWKLDDLDKVMFFSVSDGTTEIALTCDEEEFTCANENAWRFADQERTPISPDKWKAFLPFLKGPPSLYILEERIDDFESVGLLEPSTTLQVEYRPPFGIDAFRRTLQLEIGIQLEDGTGYYGKIRGEPKLLFVQTEWYESLKVLLENELALSAD